MVRATRAVVEGVWYFEIRLFTSLKLCIPDWDGLQIKERLTLMSLVLQIETAQFMQI